MNYSTPSTPVKISNYHIIETIYSGSRTIVYRAVGINQQLPVVIKLLKNPYPTFSELVQFRNQYTIAKNINSPLIIKTYSLEPYQNRYALVMEDFGGISLKEWKTGGNLHSLQDFFKTALTLCDILDLLYRERIIHKDIKPSNILINPSTLEIKLIDFSIASLLPRETQEIQNPNILEGTLAYISPEQTGRMNRGIDYRTDFYSLGITFYELLTGELPFQSNDPMELVHCHLAKMPLKLGNREDRKQKVEIPQVLSEIVMKLMAKNAEDRYQSALGLKHDLTQCFNQLQQIGKIEFFPIGQRDLCDRFLIPDKLYGRESEVQTLLEAFERVSKSTSEMILVAGFSGIGKTAVVNEVHKPIVRKRGYFIKGKFDQFQRNIPFATFVQAFQNLIGQLLTESEAQIQEWKEKILEALGENGQVIIDVIPSLEKIIGSQPTALELSGSAAQNRFNLLFQKFTQVFTSTKHPLVIFLDDLQWADSASLKLMQLLLLETRHLFFIGAYRDNEVSPAHPLMLTLNEIKKVQAPLNTITLAPLSAVQINQLVADTLKCSEALAQPLSELVYQKTQGNPFFATQFMKALYQEGLIQFDLSERYWRCDLSQINQQVLTDDVVEFMGVQLEKFPVETQNILKLAACIGNQFELATLAIISEKSEIEAAYHLWKLLQDGFILPTNEVYKFYVDQDSSGVTQDHSLTVTYKFLHDRVQQAAYSLIPSETKQTVHLKIGKLLKRNIPKAHLEERIFEIVGQLNIAVELITSLTARQELAEYNLMASRKAKAATAYIAALKYAKIGINLLTENCWESQYELTLKLYQVATEAAYLGGNLEEMEALAKTVLNFAKTPLDQVSVVQVQIEAFTAQGQFAKAIKTALNISQLLGVEIQEKPNSKDIEIAFKTVSDAIANRLPNELLNLPEATDPDIIAVARILTVVAPASYLSEPLLYVLVVLKKVYLSIIYGNEPTSPFAYVSYGTILCGVMGNVELGYEFGQLALDLLSRQHNSDLKGKTLLMAFIYTRHWKMPLRETLNPLQTAYCHCLDAGDLAFAGYSAYNYGLYSYFAGENLIQLETEMAGYCEALQQLKQTLTLTYATLVQQILLNLIGEVENIFILKGDAYDEQEQISLQESTGDRTGLALLWFNKLVISCLFDQGEDAAKQAQKTKEYLDAIVAFIYVPLFHFYESLAYLAVFDKRSPLEQQQMNETIAENQEKLKNWAVHAPINFQHKYDLVEAERYRILGQRIEAMEFYDQAIKGAKENRYLQEEALANELAAKFYLNWGKEQFAQIYLTNAYYCYARWGAKAKVHHLETIYPQLLHPILQHQQLNFNPLETLAFLGNSLSTSTSSTGSTSISDLLDFNSVIKAAQAISSSLELDSLISNLSRIILENSGAKRAVLILPENENWLIQAIAYIDHQDIKVILQPQLLDASQDIPLKIIHYVKNTLETVVIDQGKTEIPGLIREYMLTHQPQSVLCTPIVNQGHLVGILYLENSMISGAFTRDRLSVIKLLSSQAAISLENARLYQQAQQTLKDLQQAQLQIVQSEKMSALGNLVAGVAHEMNNPLGFISASLKQAQPTFADIIDHLKRYQDALPNPSEDLLNHAEEIDLEYSLEDLPKIIDAMILACDRLKNISTSLRTFSRADKDYKIPFNIHEGIDSTLLILKHRLKANNQRPAIEVIKNYGEIPEIDCFPGQLNQVFMNLLANGIDALDESYQGVDLETIRSNPQQIWINTEKSADGESIIIHIRDNGAGISEEVKNKIFEHLFTTKPVGKGTGLGLAIAHQIIVEKHQGSITVNSTLGKGTEFIITLPVKKTYSNSNSPTETQQI